MPPRRLLDVVRERIRMKHYSRRTERAYVGWIRRFVQCHGRRHPREMAETEVTAFLPERVIDPLRAHLTKVKQLHERDLTRGDGWVALPDALCRKYPNAARELGWQWAFPATRFYVDRQTGQRRRHHLHESVVQRAVKAAVERSGLTKRASCHTLRIASA